VTAKNRQQTFAKRQREQTVKERRDRKQEAKRAAKALKAAARRGDGEGEPPEEAEQSTPE
jgi:hypothetical protein